jgi:hypothetical protein
MPTRQTDFVSDELPSQFLCSRPAHRLESGPLVELLHATRLRRLINDQDQSGSTL